MKNTLLNLKRLAAAAAAMLVLCACSSQDVTPRDVSDEQNTPAEVTTEQTAQNAQSDPALKTDAQDVDAVLVDTLPPSAYIAGREYVLTYPGGSILVLPENSGMTPYEYTLELTKDRQYLGTLEYSEEWGEWDADSSADLVANMPGLDGAEVYYYNFDAVLVIVAEPYETDDGVRVGYVYAASLSDVPDAGEPRSAVKMGDDVFTSDRTGYRVHYLSPDSGVTAEQMKMLLTDGMSLAGEIEYQEYPFEGDGLLTNDETIAGAEAYRNGNTLYVMLKEPVERDGGYICGYSYVVDDRY